MGRFFMDEEEETWMAQPTPRSAYLKLKLHTFPITNVRFGGRAYEDAKKHVHNALEIAHSIYIPDLTKDALMLWCFPKTLVGDARRWLEELPSNSINTWEKLEEKFIQQYDPPYQAWKPTTGDPDDEARKRVHEVSVELLEESRKGHKIMCEAIEQLEEKIRNSHGERNEEKKMLRKMKQLFREIYEEEVEDEENTNFLDTADSTRRAPEPRDAQITEEEFQFIQLPENLESPKDECNNLMLQKVNEEETKEEVKGDSNADNSTRRVEHPRVAHPLTEDFSFLQFSENLDFAGESNAPVFIPTDLEGSEKKKPLNLIKEVDLSYSYHKVFMEETDSCMEPMMIIQEEEKYEEMMVEKEPNEDIPMKTPPKPPDDPILATPQKNPYHSAINFSQQLKEDESYQRFLDQVNPIIEATTIMPKLRKRKYAHVDAIDAFMDWEQAKRCAVGRKKNVRAKDGYECERDKWKARKHGRSVKKKKMQAYEVREKEKNASSEEGKVKEGVKASPDAKGTT